MDATEPLYFENFDLATIVTPVKVDVLDQLLIQSGYNEKKRQYLVKGFRQGFSIGYKGQTEKIQRTAPNLKLRIGNEIVLWNKVMLEVQKEMFCGTICGTTL